MTFSSDERPRWASFNDLRDRYPLSRNRAYKLLAQGKLKAKRLGGRTVWDLRSAEALFDALPDVGKEA